MYTNNFSPKRITLISGVAIVLILFLSMFGSIAENVLNEDIVVKQSFFRGEMSVWSTPGIHWQWFGRLKHYKKAQQMWFGAAGKGDAIPVIFNDASKGKVHGSLRVTLPTDQEHMLRIQTEFPTMDLLMTDLIGQTVTKVIYSSGPLMSAFESYAEKKNDLIYYITDQLNNGVYTTTTKKVEVTDPLTGEKKVLGVASLVEDPTAPGGYRRSENSPFAYYGIKISQVSVSDIEYSSEVNAQIAQQQEANMLIQTSKAKAAAAQQEAIRAEEEGKAAAARARWEQEKIKATAITKAEQEYEVARLEAAKAKEEAKRVQAEGEAKAAANKALVNAGLTPLERATIEKETKIGVAQALSGIKLPTVVMAGANNGGNAAMDAMGLKMMMDIVDKASK